MLCLAQFIGTGVYRLPNGMSDGYRLRGFDGIPGAGLQIDLREDVTKVDGYGLGWVPDTETINERGVIPLLSDKGELLGKAASDELRRVLGFDPARVTDGESLMKELLFGRESRRWGQVIPEVNTGWKRVYINCQEWAKEHVTVSKQLGIDPADSFIRANETPLAAPWVKCTGSAAANINLASNSIASSATGDKFYYYTGSVSHADQFSEIRENSAVNNDDFGPALRILGSSLTGYWYSGCATGTPFNRLVGGVFTGFGAGTPTGSANGDVWKMTCVGSTLRGYKNGVEALNSPITESTITGAGAGVGVFIYDTGGGLNNWQGGNFISLEADEGSMMYNKSEQW